MPVPVLGKKFRINFFCFGSVLVSLKKKNPELNKHRFLVLWKKIEIKIPELKNCPFFFVVSKNQRTNGFRQRTGPKKKNRRFLEFLISFEKTVATLKKNGYLRRILRTGG